MTLDQSFPRLGSTQGWERVLVRAGRADRMNIDTNTITLLSKNCRDLQDLFGA